MMEVTQESADRIANLAQELSPSSSVLGRLLRAFQSEDVDFNYVCTIVESDPVLAGNVLQVANSGLYGRSTRVVSIPRAISLLGLTRVQNIALALSVLRLWGKLEFPWWWSQRKFGQHSLATAVFCDQLACRLPTRDAEGAFVAGLFHGIGKLAFVLLCRKDVHKIFPGLDDKMLQRCLTEIQYDVLGCSFAEAGAIMAAEWKLPPEIQTAIVRPYSRPVKVDGAFALGQIVGVGHEAVGRLGFSYMLCHPEETGSIEPLLSDLGLEENPEQFTAQFKQMFQTLSGF